ncbi:MAG: sodium:solute symporter [Bacteroidetes bacterium]|nr:sodium:solute symporter [Rhodothermia bacterium]MCX7907484.1 sodium:solute symporter [Bacteroidota bacterium]MDW8284585.1 sodium:solute symporter [Bacteroidota bacterium]
MLTAWDAAVIVLYFAASAALGIRLAGRQRSVEDYFLGGRSVPWWAVLLSVVATETSALTVISVPAVAFMGDLTFLQLAFGYVLGRIVVSALFLPAYYRGGLETAYAFLGHRFGDRLRGATSLVFLATRLLADGVRLFAAAIPIKVVCDQLGLSLSYAHLIAAIGLVTVLYTYVGGLRAVIWVDVLQLAVYLVGALWALGLLLEKAPADWVHKAAKMGKLRLFHWGAELSLLDWLRQNYTLITGLVGGAVFTMASHGTDQLIVQRLLACRSLRASQRALVGSGLFVLAQFGLFLSVGLLLWAYYGARSGTYEPRAILVQLGLSRADEVFPRFLLEGLPPGLSGLVLAGIMAAAMSTLSSSLSALSSSTVLDLYQRWFPARWVRRSMLPLARLVTLFWGAVFIGFALLFRSTENPVVELGLSIASFTYGGLLGVFLLGLLFRRPAEQEALIAFGCAIAGMILFIALVRIGWPWYTLIGAILTIGVAHALVAVRRLRPERASGRA